MVLQPKSHNLAPKVSRRKLLRYWILGALLVVMAGTGLKFAKPVVREIRARQAASLAKEARVHIEAEEWREASSTLRKAYKTAPHEPEVTRTLARFYSFADLKRERKYLNDLYRMGEHNAEDLRRLVALELRFSDLQRAAALTEELLRDFPQDKENLEIAVTASKALEDPATTENLLRRILTVDPEDYTVKFDLAKILARSSFGEKVSSGWDEIYALARREDETGLEALRLIVRREPVYPGRAREIQELTERHPDSTDKDHIAALGWHHQVISTEAERVALLEEAIEKRKGRPLADNRNLFFWLNSIRKEEVVLELLPWEAAVADPTLLTVYVTAMIQDRQLDELRELFESEDKLENSSEVFFIKAQCAVFLKMSSTKIRQYLQESYELALLDKRSEMLSHIAKFAEKQGMRDLSHEVYESMSNIPETSLTGYQKLLETARNRRDLTAMREIAREIKEKIPGNATILKLTTYLELLHGTNLETAFNTVRDLSARSPQDNECTMILAFAYFRFGDLEKAVELCQRCDLAKLSPSRRAIYALIRGSAGDALEAVSVTEKIPRSLLLNEELALVAPWMPRI